MDTRHVTLIKRLAELDTQSVKFGHATNQLLKEGYTKGEITRAGNDLGYDAQPNDVGAQKDASMRLRMATDVAFADRIAGKLIAVSENMDAERQENNARLRSYASSYAGNGIYGVVARCKVAALTGDTPQSFWQRALNNVAGIQLLVLAVFVVISHYLFTPSPIFLILAIALCVASCALNTVVLIRTPARHIASALSLFIIPIGFIVITAVASEQSKSLVEGIRMCEKSYAEALQKPAEISPVPDPGMQIIGVNVAAQTSLDAANNEKSCLETVKTNNALADLAIY